MSTAVPVTMAKIYFIKNKNRLCSMTCGIDTIFRIFKIKKIFAQFIRGRSYSKDKLGVVVRISPRREI